MIDDLSAPARSPSTADFANFQNVGMSVPAVQDFAKSLSTTVVDSFGKAVDSTARVGSFTLASLGGSVNVLFSSAKRRRSKEEEEMIRIEANKENAKKVSHRWEHQPSHLVLDQLAMANATYDANVVFSNSSTRLNELVEDANDEDDVQMF